VVDSDSDSTDGAADLSDEMSVDSEEFVPKAVHDMKLGRAVGKRGTHTLYLIEWDEFPNEIDFTWEPYDNLGAHTKLADVFTDAWKTAGKPWPLATAPLGLGAGASGAD
jgi:hypothetical protein